MGWGLFKKVVVADRLALVASPVFAAPHQYTGLPLIAAVLFLTIQIYCDFSGYSDIALGSARVMGFTLMENFKQPYGSRSVAEFWTRWHVSLSTWFRDYVYIPLGGNRAHWARNVIVVFLLSGLWHGANWTFVVWGGLHAGYMLIERALGSWRARLPQVLQVGLTFAAVAFAWIFFRANTLADAAYVAGHLVAGLGAQLKSPGAAWAALAAVPVEAAQWPLALAAIAVLELVQLALRRGASWTWLVAQPAWVRWPVYQMLAWAIVLFGTFENRAFIYFQF
jgi:D-alanyl-lipoteichoic acid acyltransferase DltB (MBOAT superfamily)